MAEPQGAPQRAPQDIMQAGELALGCLTVYRVKNKQHHTKVPTDSFDLNTHM